VDALELIFKMQADLQRRINGYELSDQSTAQRVDNIKLNVLSCTDELHELLNETSWKPWTKGEPFINRDLAVKEGVDALHFLINLFLHLDVSPGELLERYTSKNTTNHKRQSDNYDGVHTKCAGCKRALEDLVITQIHGDDGRLIFKCACGVDIDPKTVAELGD
jgi:dimeric dUTPase (all-alpha-NTP-PPase superfamily)